MTAFSDAIETNIITHLLRTGSWDKATTHTGNQVFFAVYNTLPAEDGTGEVEADYTSYARIAIDQLAAEWTYSVTATGVRIANTNDITLVTPTANGTDLAGFGVCPSNTADPSMVGTFDAPIAAENGTAIVLSAGDVRYDLNQLNLDMTDYLAEKIMKHLFWADTWTKAAALFLRIYTTMPAKTGAGGVGVSGNGYADVAAGPLDATWDATSAGDGQSPLPTDLTFPNPTADWVACLGQGIHDGTSALLIRPFASSTTFVNGSTVRLVSGSTVTAA